MNFKTLTLTDARLNNIITQEQLDFLESETSREFVLQNQLHPGKIISTLLEHGVIFDHLNFIDTFEAYYKFNFYYMETISGEADYVQNQFVLISYLQDFLNEEYRNLINETHEHLNTGSSDSVLRFILASHRIQHITVTAQIDKLEQYLLDD